MFFGTRFSRYNRNISLHTGETTQPYIARRNGVAHADTRRLLSDKDRQLAGQVRRVEDPYKTKEKAKKVGTSTPKRITL